jgi:hypothetical protein
VSAQIQEHAVALQGAHAAIVSSNLNRLRSNEAALSKDQFGTACLAFVHVHADKAIHHPPFASLTSAISIDAGAVQLPKSRS